MTCTIPVLHPRATATIFIPVRFIVPLRRRSERVTTVMRRLARIHEVEHDWPGSIAHGVRHA